MNNLSNNFTADSFEGAEVVRSGLVDVYPLRDIYLTCSGLGTFNTMSAFRDRDFIRKIPVNAGFGGVVYHESATGLDSFGCSRQTLSHIFFQFKVIYGSIIDINGAHISFSIVSSGVQDGG